jgi:hypothetical protein
MQAHTRARKNACMCMSTNARTHARPDACQLTAAQAGPCARGPQAKRCVRHPARQRGGPRRCCSVWNPVGLTQRISNSKDTWGRGILGTIDRMFPAPGGPLHELVIAPHNHDCGVKGGGIGRGRAGWGVLWGWT